jgi:chromosome partitioning protein
MPVVAVVNPKGGVGKTTLATNLAGYFAVNQHRTMLGDFDRQQSARYWLKLRPKNVAPIETWEMNGEIARPPKGVTHVVLDTPAQLTGKHLADVVRVSEKILVPLQPSLFDVLATRDFLAELRAAFRDARSFKEAVAIVGVRLDPRTRSAEELSRFVTGAGLPVAGYLRDTQNYVHLAAHGLTMFDVPPSQVDRDIATWRSLVGWIERH